MKKIRILIADDHTLLRIGLKTLCECQKDMTVVGEACDGEEAVARAAELKPDVVLMDLMMPKMNGSDQTYSRDVSRNRNRPSDILCRFGRSRPRG